MKKIILFLAAIAMVGLTSCNSCGSKEEKSANDSTQVVKAGELVPEHVISTDREAMYLKFGSDYRWFETAIKLKDFLDEECDGSIASIENVFQAIVDQDEKSADVYVCIFGHSEEGDTVVTKHSFWVEDMPLLDEEIKLSYKDAFEKVMETNSPKPHSRNCILRKPVGPLDCNPQWIFGNIRAQLWVDAVTGEVKSSNPAFPDEPGFKMPLGEWP